MNACVDDWWRDPPAPEMVPPSVFTGRGIFTVERPQDASFPGVWRLDALDPFTWFLDTRGLICQAEGPEQLAAALKLGPAGAERALVTNLFMDSWPEGWTCMPEAYWNADGGQAGYGRSVPNMIYRAKQVIGPKWGRVPVVPVVGCYDASSENAGVGIRLTLPDYLPDLRAAMRAWPCVVGYAVWRIETLAAADFTALRGVG